MSEQGHARVKGREQGSGGGGEERGRRAWGLGLGGRGGTRTGGGSVVHLRGVCLFVCLFVCLSLVVFFFFFLLLPFFFCFFFFLAARRRGISAISGFFGRERTNERHAKERTLCVQLADNF